MGYLDYAGLQYLWGKLKEKFAPKSHSHDDRYYTESEMDGKLNEKAVNKTLSKVDLNTIKTPGFYNAGGGNGCINVPVSDAFGLIVTHNANGEFYTQIFFLVNKNISYRRYCNSGTWSGWTQDKLTDTNTWRGIQNNLTSDSTSDSLSAAQGKVLKGLVDGKAPNGHTHTKSQVGLGNVDNTADANKSVKYATSAGTSNSCTGNAATATGIKDYGDTNKTIKIGYAGAGLTTSNLTHIAGYASNGTQIKDVSKDVLKSWIGLGNYLSLSGGTMSGQITFSDHSHGKIYSGPTDNVNGPGGDLNNIVIESWNGLSFTTGCPEQTYTGKTAVGIDCREGVVKAARFDGTLTGTAATLGGGGNPYAPMTFNWSGKDGQPIWLWGGNDGVNMYVYNPSNFKVNWAQSAANGVYTNGFNGSGGYIRFCNGVQICWGRTNCSGNDTTINFSAAFSDSSYSVSTMPFYSNFAGTYWNVKEGSMGTTSFVLHGSKSSIDLRTMLWIAIGKWN